MRRLAAPVVAAALAGLGPAGCDLSRDDPAGEPDAGVEVDAPPPPRDDLVPPVGSASTLDVATWNIEFFPKADRTVEVVADLIASLRLDLIVVEEVASIAAWDELVARLPDHGGVLSSHRYTPSEYQKIGVLYREDLIEVTGDELLFVEDGYNWPRPALLVHARVGDVDLDVIGLHLKAGRTSDDRDRRIAAIQDLDAWIAARAATEDEVLILGDWNEDLEPDDLAFAPLIAAPERYTIHTWPLEEAQAASFIPSGSLIDHVVTTAGLAGEVAGGTTVIPPLDAQLPRYEPDVSDHLPVVLSFPMP